MAIESFHVKVHTNWLGKACGGKTISDSQVYKVGMGLVDSKCKSSKSRLASSSKATRV